MWTTTHFIQKYHCIRFHYFTVYLYKKTKLTHICEYSSRMFKISQSFTFFKSIENRNFNWMFCASSTYKARSQNCVGNVTFQHSYSSTAKIPSFQNKPYLRTVYLSPLNPVFGISKLLNAIWSLYTPQGELVGRLVSLLPSYDVTPKKIHESVSMLLFPLTCDNQWRIRSSNMHLK